MKEKDMEEQDVYQITVTVAPVADNDKGLRMTFTDMVTGAMIEWQIEDVNGKALRLLYAAFTDDALEEMFEMIMTTVEETRKALNDGTD
jgi:hypothetical protein